MRAGAAYPQSVTPLLEHAPASLAMLARTAPTLRTNSLLSRLRSLLKSTPFKQVSTPT